MRAISLLGLITLLLILTPICSLIFDQKADLETINRISKDMKIDQKEEITKEEFEQFFMRVVTKDKKVEHNYFYKSVFERYMKDIPAKVKTEDLITYVDFDKLEEIMLDKVKEQYGPENAEAVRRKLKEYQKERERVEKKKSHNVDKNEL